MEAITLRCRLCLTVFDDPSKLGDIFRDKEHTHLGCRIRECTGIYVSPKDALTTICTGCRSTVDFIDEFRARCRKADRNFERLAEGMTVGWDSARLESYLYHVGELRKLLEPVKVQPQSGGSGYLPETVFVKAQDAGGFEWEELVIKQEAGGSDNDGGEDDDEVEEEEEEDQEAEEYVPKRKRKRVDWEIEPLTLAKAIYKHPVLWDSKHEGHTQTHLRDRAWDSLAATIKLDKSQLRKRWSNLNDMLHKKRWGTDAQDVELYQLLGSMFGSSSRRRSKFELTDETRTAMAKVLKDVDGDDRMKLAQLFYKREDIWNRSHPHFDDHSKWNSFSDQINTPVDTLKRHWKCFRDIYYARRRRLLVGEIKPNHQCLQDPFYLLLEKMCSGSARSSHPLQPPPEDIAPLPEIDRTQFTNLIYAREVIWNQAHPDHPYTARREQAFNEVARLLDITNKQLKVHWRKLKCFYNNRNSREKRGQLSPDNPLLLEPVYLTLKKIFGDSSVEEGAA